MSPRRKKKGQSVQRLEYWGIRIAIQVVRALPFPFIDASCHFLGNALFALLPRRREIAVGNLRTAFGSTKSEDELRSLARQSCKSLLLTAAEVMKFNLTRTSDSKWQKEVFEKLQEPFKKARMIHDRTGGAIFVTPHLGNWELLPYVSSSIGIPMALVARPLDNAYLNDLIYRNRSLPGQFVVPKKNALLTLKHILRQGKSIGMLPDQSTDRGVSVDFFGRKASTTPVPALLAIHFKRPIVVVACCRVESPRGFEGIVSDPIWPRENAVEREEIIRLTEAMNRNIETIVKAHPEQYLWMHNRWKTYRTRPFLAGGWR